MGTQIAARGNDGRLFLLSGLRFFHGDDSTGMFWVQNRCTSMLEEIPEDDEEGDTGEDSKKY